MNAKVEERMDANNVRYMESMKNKGKEWSVKG